MKPRAYIFSTGLLLMIFISTTVLGQSYSKEKRIEKVFPVLDDTEIEISNKYGDITFESWEKDSVKIVINYKVTSTKETKLNKTFDAISFDFKVNKYYIVATTEFIGQGSFWSDVSDIASNLFSGGTNSSIDYTIYAPDNKHLSISLKYGNVYLANHEGPLKLSLSNGDFKAHNLGSSSDIKIVFGDATINEINKGEIKINYGTLNIEDAGSIHIIGQTAEIEIGTVDELSIDSKRDKFFIEKANNISGNTYFSRVHINDLNNKLELTTKYGSLKINEIMDEVKDVSINSTNTSVNMNLDSMRSYSIGITSDEKADVTYSSDIGDFTTKEINGKEKLMHAECVFGKKDIAIPITINIRSGFLAIKLR